MTSVAYPKLLCAGLRWGMYCKQNKYIIILKFHISFKLKHSSKSVPLPVPIFNFALVFLKGWRIKKSHSKWAHHVGDTVPCHEEGQYWTELSPAVPGVHGNTRADKLCKGSVKGNLQKYQGLFLWIPVFTLSFILAAIFPTSLDTFEWLCPSHPNEHRQLW